MAGRRRRELQRTDERVRILALSRNFGQQIAYTAGLQAARGAGCACSTLVSMSDERSRGEELERVFGACEAARVPERDGSAEAVDDDDHPPVRRFSNCDAMRLAGWTRGVSRDGGTYRDAWDDRDRDGRACER